MLENAILDYEDGSKYASRGFLLAIIAFGQKIGCFDLLSWVRVPMKEVFHTVHIKIVTLLVSYTIACHSSHAIDTELRPETIAAKMLAIEWFADDSTFSRFYARIDPGAVEDLRNVQSFLYEAQSLARHLNGVVLVDIDGTGLTVKGNQFELADEGYFANNRGSIGYQLSIACASNAGKEILAHLLTPGHINSGDQFLNVLYSIGDALGFLDKRVFIRADRAYGVGTYVYHLLQLGVGFLIKGRDPRTAKKWVNRLGRSIRWVQVDENCWVADIGRRKMPSCPKSVRTILIRIFNPKTQTYNYSYFVTTLPWERCTAWDIFHFYNQRVTIEKLIERCKNVWHISHMPTHQFWGLKFYFELRFLAYNLVLWYQHHVLETDETFQAMKVFELVTTVAPMAVVVERRSANNWVFYLANAPKLIRSLLAHTQAWLRRFADKTIVLLGKHSRLRYAFSDLFLDVWRAGQQLGKPLIPVSCKS